MIKTVNKAKKTNTWRDQTPTQHLLNARHRSKHFPCVKSLTLTTAHGGGEELRSRSSSAGRKLRHRELLRGAWYGVQLGLRPGVLAPKWVLGTTLGSCASRIATASPKQGLLPRPGRGFRPTSLTVGLTGAAEGLAVTLVTSCQEQPSPSCDHQKWLQTLPMSLGGVNHS